MAKKVPTPKLLEWSAITKTGDDTLDWVLYGLLKDTETRLVNECYRNGSASVENLQVATNSAASLANSALLQAAKAIVQKEQLPIKRGWCYRFWHGVVWHQGMLQNLLAGLISTGIAISFTIWLATIPSCRKSAAEKVLGQPIPLPIDSVK